LLRVLTDMAIIPGDTHDTLGFKVVNFGGVV
jgi:hypothetical protein